MKSVAVLVDVVHESLWLILGIHDTNVSENTVVSLLMGHSLFQKVDKLFTVAEFLVVLNQIFQMIWMNDDVKTTDGGGFELSSSDAREADCFPDLWDVGFSGSLQS